MNLLTENLDYIFFLYGLSFIILGAICLAHGTRTLSGFSCCWLSVFALLHGVNEWLDLLTLSTGDTTPFMALRLIVMSASFLALMEFGRLHARPPDRNPPGPWIYVPLLTAAAIGVWREPFIGAFVTVRLALGFPAGLLAAWSLWRISYHHNTQVAGSWRLASLAMLAYAVVTGLVVPQAAELPAAWLHGEQWLALTGVPIEAARALCAVLITAGIWRAYQNAWRKSVGGYIAGLEIRSGRLFVATLILVLIVGLGFTGWVSHRRGEIIREDLRYAVRMLAQSINTERVRMLNSADAKRLHEQIAAMVAMHPLYQYLYIATVHDDRLDIQVGAGSVSQPEMSHPDPMRSPWRLAWEQKTDSSIHRSDAGGVHVLTPLFDRQTGDAIALFGAVIDDSQWRRAIAQARLMTIFATLFLSIIVVSSYVLTRKTEEHRWATLLGLALEGGELVIWDWNVPSGRIVFGESYAQILGCPPENIDPHIRDWEQRIHPDDRPRVMEALQAHLDGRTPRYEAEYRYRTDRGDWIWLLDRGRVILRSRGGRPVRCSGTFMDITVRKQIELREQTSEATYRNLIDSVSEAGYVHETEGRILDVNRAAERMAGYQREEYIGRTPDFLSAPGLNSAEEMRKHIAGALNGELQSFEFWNLSRDGRITPQEITLSPTTYFGQPAIIAVARDTSERKRSERIREAMYRLSEEATAQRSFPEFCRAAHRAVSNLLPAGSLYVAVTNPATGQVEFPYFADERDAKAQTRPPAKGLTDYVFATGEVARWSRPGFTEKSRQAGYAPLGTLAPDWIGIPLKSEGRTFAMMGVQDYHDSTRYDETDEAILAQVGGKVADVYLRFQATEALRQSEEIYRQLFNCMTNGFCLNEMICDERGRLTDYRFTEINPAFEALTELKARDVIGRTAREIFGDVSTYWISKLEGLAADGAPVYFQYQSTRVNTDHEVYAYRTRPGQFAILFADITGRKQVEQERLDMERRLQHGQKLESLGLMAGGIAHDFNNLLMAILGNLELAQENVSPVSAARHDIEEAMHAARRAADLTRQMLAYSGKGTFLIKSLDLNELVAENAHMLQAAIPRNVTFDLRLHEALPPIKADPGQIQQIIMNLITNAAEAIGQASGLVTLSTGVEECDAAYLAASRLDDKPHPGTYVWVEVSDTGCGMDPDVLHRLFDPFFSTKFTGRGLGLAATLGIVRGHRGAIIVQSRVNEGTTFRVLFPAAAAPAITEADAFVEPPPRPVAPRAKQTGMILVVEDDPAIRKLCISAVERAGFTSLAAADGRDAIPLFRNHRAQIAGVLLDLTMPGMDGVTTLKELRVIDPGIKVILCSGYSEQEAVRRFAGQTLTGFVQKPFELNSLRDLVAQSFADGNGHGAGTPA